MTLLDTIKSLLGLDDGRRSSNQRNGFNETDRSETVEPATETEAAVKGTDEDTEHDEPAAAGGDAAGSTETMVDEGAEGGAEPGEVTGPASGGETEPAITEIEEDTGDTTEESAAAGGDAAGSTGSMTDEDSSDVAAEPGEAAGPESGDADLELDHDGAASADEGESTDTPGDGTDNAADESAAAGGDAAGSTGSMTEETNDTISATENAEAVGPTTEDPTGDTEDMAVTALKGIGPSYSDQLGAAGIETVADLVAADPAELAAETEMPESRIERWTERAKARRQ